MRLPHLNRTSILTEILSHAALGTCSVNAFKLLILPKGLGAASLRELLLLLQENNLLSQVQNS